MLIYVLREVFYQYTWLQKHIHTQQGRHFIMQFVQWRMTSMIFIDAKLPKNKNHWLESNYIYWALKTELCSPTVCTQLTLLHKGKKYSWKKCTQHCKMKRKSYLLIVNQAIINLLSPSAWFHGPCIFFFT